MNTPTLHQACCQLFGDQVVIGNGFLEYLQLEGLKGAYRKRVRETHPDRRPMSACSSEAFISVQRAYEVLASYLKKRDNGRIRATNIGQAVTPMDTAGPNRCSSLQDIAPIVLPNASCPQSHKSSIDRLYQGSLPNRPLLFGHFLYYSGLTTWRTITSVLVQQQRNRPFLGELGASFGVFSIEDIPRVLQGKSTIKKPFGAVAMSLGLLNEDQLQTLLKHQQMLQKKFGTILVEKELINQQELAFLLFLFRRHNRLSLRTNTVSA